MSELISWLGNASYGVAGTRLREANPIVFRPNDISGLQIWMDANDRDTVNANPFGTVESWHNKGDLSGNFDLSGGGADIQYGLNNVNGLEVVTFTANSFMQGTFTMNFQDRSMFFVSRRAIDVSGGTLTWLTSDTAGGVETGIVKSGPTYYYLLSQHPGFAIQLGFQTTTNTTGSAELVSFTNSSTDLSGNTAGFYSVNQALIASNLASGYNTSAIPYFLGNYFGGSALPNEYDMCEVIVYDSVLTPTQVDQVEEYLTVKWGLVAPAPPPFAPDDIAGLSVWLDGSNASSFTLSGTDVLSWSNVGSVGGVYAPGCNVASYNSSQVSFSPTTTLDTYAQLPYVSRTVFCVFQCVSDLTTITYPYVNLNVGGATDGRQLGVSYDSNSSLYSITVCQAGTNCPIGAPFATLPSGLNLVCAVVDSNSALNNAAYLNNGSNINTSTDLGNLFNTNPIPYSIGSPVADSPAFRLAEFLEYNSILASSNISTVTGYLNTKWSLGF